MYGWKFGLEDGWKNGWLDCLFDDECNDVYLFFNVYHLNDDDHLIFRFFGLYQGSRQVLEFTWDQPWEYHVLLSGTLCLTPMVAVSQFRPLFPYCAILVAIDAFNEYQEGSKS